MKDPWDGLFVLLLLSVGIGAGIWFFYYDKTFKDERQRTVVAFVCSMFLPGFVLVWIFAGLQGELAPLPEEKVPPPEGRPLLTPEQAQEIADQIERSQQ